MLTKRLALSTTKIAHCISNSILCVCKTYVSATIIINFRGTPGILYQKDTVLVKIFWPPSLPSQIRHYLPLTSSPNTQNLTEYERLSFIEWNLVISAESPKLRALKKHLKQADSSSFGNEVLSYLQSIEVKTCLLFATSWAH